MTPAELLNLFRIEVDDQVEPYLWSDFEFYTYLNEAQNTFTSLIGGIADQSSKITQLNYSIGDEFLPFDERILFVKNARDESNNRVVVQNYNSFIGSYDEDDYGNVADSDLEDGKTGTIRFLITDVEDNKFRLYPIPDHAGTLKLYTFRLPMAEITGPTSELEIATRHHIHLLSYVKYKAMSKQDVETFELGSPQEFYQEFIQYVALAGKEKSGREDRKRTVRYGGL